MALGRICAERRVQRCDLQETGFLPKIGEAEGYEIGTGGGYMLRDALSSSYAYEKTGDCVIILKV